MYKQFYFTTILFLFLSLSINAQVGNDTLFLSIEQAVKLAVSNNPDLKRVQMGSALLDRQIQGAKASGLPQLKGKAGFTDNFSLAQQLLPGEIFGQSGQIPVKFGVQYSLTAGVELNQQLYSREYITNLRKLGATKKIVELQTFATMEDLVYNVAQRYIQFQTTVEQKELVTANLERINQLIQISNAQFENDIIKKLDVDQMKVNRTNLLAEASNIEIALEQQMNYIRFYLDVDDNMTIVLNEKMDNTSRFPLSNELLLSQNTNFQIMSNQLDLTKLDNDVIKAGYYPTLSAFAQYNYTGQANNLNFKSDNYSDFTAGLWGLNMSIPMFDGFGKKNRLQENKIKYDQQQLELKTIENATRLEYRNAISNIRQNEKLISTQLENMDLATEVYEITKLSYQEGVAPLTELLNAESGLKESQSQYLTALINFKLAELSHIKASGQLAQLLKSSN